MKQERVKELQKLSDDLIRKIWSEKNKYQIRTMEELGFIFRITAVRVFQIINK